MVGAQSIGWCLSSHYSNRPTVGEINSMLNRARLVSDWWLVGLSVIEDQRAGLVEKIFRAIRSVAHLACHDNHAQPVRIMMSFGSGVVIVEPVPHLIISDCRPHVVISVGNQFVAKNSGVGTLFHPSLAQFDFLVHLLISLLDSLNRLVLCFDGDGGSNEQAKAAKA